MRPGKKEKTVVYLHIGSQKTGTTAMQKLLNTNADALKRQSAVYPDFDLHFEGVDSNVNAHWLAAGEYDEQTASACFEKINELADTYRTIILSDEILWNSAAHSTQFWENVRAHLREDIELYMLAYVRRQDLYAYSFWAQQVKAQKRYDFDTQSFSRFLEGKEFNGYYSKYMDYWKYAQAGIEVLGIDNVIFRVFERERFADGNLYADFFNAVGLSLTPDFKIPTKLENISLKGNILEAKRYLNRTPEFSQHGYRLLPYLVEAQKNMEESGTLRIRNDFPKEERLKLLKKYEKSNALIAKNMLNSKDGVLFKDPVADDREPASEYTTEEILDACAQVMLVMMDECRRDEDAKGQLEEARRQLEAIRRSHAYRVGRMITAPVRALKKAVRQRGK